MVPGFLSRALRTSSALFNKILAYSKDLKIKAADNELQQNGAININA